MKYFLLFLLTTSTFSILKAQENHILIGDYNSLMVYAGIEVNFIKGEDNKIILSHKNEDTSVFVYKIKNKVLKLKVAIDKKLSLGNIFVDVYYKNEIDEINLFQGSTVLFQDSISQTNLKIKAQEGSLLEGIVNTGKTSIEVASGGSVSLKGRSSVVEIKASTGGICLAEELSSKQTKIQASIGSVVYAKSSLLMDAKASTGAIIRVHGNPKKLILKTSLGGSIKQMK